MAGYRKLPDRLGDLPRDRGEIARDVDTEIAFHLEMRVRDLMRGGASEADARERALREFGDVAGLSAWLQRADAQQQRRRRWWTSFAELHRDVRFGWRSLWRAPVFTAAALATLTLGVGAAVAVFTVVQTVVLRPLPYAEPERLVQVLPGVNFNLALADAVAEGAPSLEAVTGLSLWSLTLTGEGEPAQLTAQFADAAFFRVFGVQPELGRVFGPEHREPARSDVVVLSHGLWQSRFGGDRHVIGRRIALDGSGHHTREVIGVMPAGFNAPLTASGEQVDAWAPLSRAPGRTVATDSTWYLNVVAARLAPGATVERAAQEVRTVMTRLRADYASIMDEEFVTTAGAVGLLDAMVGDVRDTLWTLLAAVALVLLLACANLANLLLARGDRRRQELSIRAALGAGRGRLVRGLLTESAVLALLGGAGGVLLAQLILSALRVMETSSLPRASELRMDLPVLGFALLVSIGSLFLFGLLPAWRASGGSGRSELSGGSRTRGWTRASRRLGSALIAGEIALAMVLVTGAGLLLGSLHALRAVEPGMDSSDVLALELAPAPAKYSGGRAHLFYQQVQQRLAALPGVQAVGAIQLLPFTDGNWSFPYLAEGHAPPAGAPLPSANFRVVTPDYFAAVDVPLLSGRALADTDAANGEAVGVINRKLAQLLWPGADAVGRTIRLFGSEPFRVVGVVGDVHQFALDRQPEPEMYLPLAQWGRVSAMIVMIETERDPAALTSLARAAIWQIDPDVPIRDARALDDVLGASMARSRFFTGVLTFFGMLAITLGAVGVYGVMAYAVGARLPEYGIRLALGASSQRILRDALLAGLAPVLLGLALGLAGAIAATRLLRGLLFGIEARDPIVLLLAAIVLGAAATLAIWLPARTVRKLNPVHALRAD